MPAELECRNPCTENVAIPFPWVLPPPPSGEDPAGAPAALKFNDPDNSGLVALIEDI